MTARHVDALLDRLASETAQKCEAQATAAIATDLVVRWAELLMEKPHTTDEQYLHGLDCLLTESRFFIESVPTWASTTSAAAGDGGGPIPSSGDAGRSGGTS